MRFLEWQLYMEAWRLGLACNLAKLSNYCYFINIHFIDSLIGYTGKRNDKEKDHRVFEVHFPPRLLFRPDFTPRFETPAFPLARGKGHTIDTVLAVAVMRVTGTPTNATVVRKRFAHIVFVGQDAGVAGASALQINRSRPRSEVSLVIRPLHGKEDV